MLSGVFRRNMVPRNTGAVWDGSSSFSSAVLRGKHLCRRAKDPAHRFHVACLMIAMITLGTLYGYYLVMTEYGHGTFLPPFVQMSTEHYTRSGITRNLQGRWDKPTTVRIAVSMTSMPHHLEWLHETLDSLLFGQTMLPDVLYLSIPIGRARTGDEYYVPDYLNHTNPKYRYSHPRTIFESKSKKDASSIDIDGHRRQSPILRILRTDRDYGPLTKLAPALLEERDDDTIILTIDDDQIYHERTIEQLSWHIWKSSKHSDNHNNNPSNPGTSPSSSSASASIGNAWGDCGWGFLRVPHRMVITRVYVPFWLREVSGRRVQVIEGICGNAFQRKFFPSFTVLTEMQPSECRTTDDLWIAGYLEFVQDYVSRVRTLNNKDSQNNKNDDDDSGVSARGSQTAMMSQRIANIDGVRERPVLGKGPIPRVLVSEDFAPKKTQWKLEKEDWSKTLHDYNVKHSDARIKCIRAIERVFGQVWVP